MFDGRAHAHTLLPLSIYRERRERDAADARGIVQCVAEVAVGSCCGRRIFGRLIELCHDGAFVYGAPRHSLHDDRAPPLVVSPST